MVIRLIGNMEQNLFISAEEGLFVDEQIVTDLITNLSKDCGFSIENLEFNFVSNETILDINKKHLDHHYYTDIITFNYSGENDNLDGEIFISYDEALENSKRYECEPKTELVRLVIHGILHLLGYDDIEESDKVIMKEKENEFVLKYDPQIRQEFAGYES